MNLAGKYIMGRPAPVVPGSDPRDYPLEVDAKGNPIFWASQALPLGVTIDEAIKQGTWRGKT